MPLTQGKLINKTDAATSEYGSLRIVKIGDAKISDMYGAPVRQIYAADQVEQRTFSNAALTDYHGNFSGGLVLTSAAIVAGHRACPTEGNHRGIAPTKNGRQ